MFKHKGKSRTYIHNLRLASILSLVAGLVNITGVLAVKTLTTNVTGHFAYFSEELSNKNYSVAVIYLFFILSFLIGAFFSNLLIEIISRVKPSVSYAVPMMIEIIILTMLGIFTGYSGVQNNHQQIIACILLFTMGLQNALVTNASQSVVRTTHLTGLFTDLGIELSQMFFYKKNAQAGLLLKSIYLKLAIIGCFFLGCIAGGFIFKMLAYKTLLVAVGFLIIALFYDNILFQYYQLKRKVQTW